MGWWLPTHPNHRHYTIFIFGIRALRVSTSVACGGAEGKGKEGMASKGSKAVRLREGLWTVGFGWAVEYRDRYPGTSHLLPILHCTAAEQSQPHVTVCSALLHLHLLPKSRSHQKNPARQLTFSQAGLGTRPTTPDPSSLPTATPRFTTQQPPKTTAHGRAGAQTGRRCSTPCSACSVHVWVGDCYGCRLADVNTQ